MENLIKDKVASMVREAIKGRMDGVILSWPDHSIRFLGSVPEGKGPISFTDVDDYQTRIKVQTNAGPKYFIVKVAEQL